MKRAIIKDIGSTRLLSFGKDLHILQNTGEKEGPFTKWAVAKT